MKHRRIYSAGILIFCLIVIATVLILFFQQESQVDMSHSVSITPLKEVLVKGGSIPKSKRLFFAHMSVGYNILDGIKPAAQMVNLDLPIIQKTADPTQMTEGGLYHTEVGHNCNPDAKIASFKQLMNDQASSLPDAAMMKFCYVDINESTDVDRLFESYRSMITDLEQAYPNVTFLHCTVPLTSGPVSLKQQIKSTLKSLLGRNRSIETNAKRHALNEKIRTEYPANRIFDIALFESTDSAGHPSYSMYQNQQIPVMLTEYTTDGGHLNEAGRQRLGEQFLVFWVTALKE